MAGPLPFQDILDQIVYTLKHYQTEKWVDLTQEFNYYTFADMFRGKLELEKLPVRGGLMLDFKLQVENSGNVRDTALYDEDEVLKINVMDEAHIRWAMQTGNYVMDVREEKFQDGHRLIDCVEVEEHGLWNKWWALAEQEWWTSPPSASAKRMPMAGVPFWIRKNATWGFNGGDPGAGWPLGCGDVLSTDVPAWQNFTGTYALVSEDDLVEKILLAMEYCEFRPPDDFPSLVPTKPQWQLYTTLYVKNACGKLARAANDNAGSDLAKFRNTPLINGVPVRRVPALDTNTGTNAAYDSSNPVYALNLATFKYFFKTGEDLKKWGPLLMQDRYHTVYKRGFDNAGNSYCNDRRRNFVLYKV